ncbi:MAG: hypothetical protein JNN07_00230 [Verrucomicrobiales bacterium]|nr:hypothetical protein [Verrucomicrobiales bacterium]
MTVLRGGLFLGLCLGGASVAQPGDRFGNAELLPEVPPGFSISVFARDPVVRNPWALAFDDRGRLCVGMGPQYPAPQPDTPGDRIVVLEDVDGDGVAEVAKTFAEGLNCIQGMAWHGRELWVGNAPDLTVLRDVDGDDIADEYVKIYTDLGSSAQGLYGLTWAPDGRLYFCKGSSSGLSLDGDSPREPGRVAPKPFRDLWGVPGPRGSPDLPPAQSFHRKDYRRTYHDSRGAEGREGGVFRCDARGRGLEIVARGCRNPEALTFDSGFNWLSADAITLEAGKLIAPFTGAHFGWGHGWMKPGAGGDVMGVTVPASVPLFPGRATGLLFLDSPLWPSAYRGAFLINDALRQATSIYRPQWDGALMKATSDPQPFLQAGKGWYQPMDLAWGPDGAVYVAGWGREPGAVWREGRQENEGRIFRIAPVPTSPRPATWRKPKRTHPRGLWTMVELIEDLSSALPAWRVNAHEELILRGFNDLGTVRSLVERGRLEQREETWLLWVIGRAYPDLGPQYDPVIRWLRADQGLNRRLQALRILAWRQSRSRADRTLAPPVEVLDLTEDPLPRIRLEAWQTLKQGAWHWTDDWILGRLDREEDPVVFFSAVDALRMHPDPRQLKRLLAQRTGPSRRGLLLSLLSLNLLDREEVLSQSTCPDDKVRQIAHSWLEQVQPGPTGRGLGLPSARSATPTGAPR